MESALFIIGSPFQALCMLEAIDYFHVTDYDVVVSYCDKRSLEQIRTLLESNEIEYEEKKIAHIIKDFFPLLLKRHRKYNNIFIGDYYSVINEIVGIVYTRRHYSLYYLDDGTQALSIFSDNPRKRFSSFKIGIVLKFYYLCLSWKKRVSTNFFTIYNVKSEKIQIIHNSFSKLKQNKSSKQEGVFIIGANSSALDFKDISYYDYLDKVLFFLRSEWPNEKIVYSPHRRDLNNKQNKKWCLTNNVEYVESSVSVDYDFTIKGISPTAIVGFTSNALYSLKSIYDSAKVYTVYYNLCDKVSDRETQIIRRNMLNSGILNLKF